MCSSERIPLAKALLQIFRHEKQEKVILKTMNDFEINREGRLLEILIDCLLELQWQICPSCSGREQMNN